MDVVNWLAYGQCQIEKCYPWTKFIIALLDNSCEGRKGGTMGQNELFWAIEAICVSVLQDKLILYQSMK